MPLIEILEAALPGIEAPLCTPVCYLLNRGADDWDVKVLPTRDSFSICSTVVQIIGIGGANLLFAHTAFYTSYENKFQN